MQTKSRTTFIVFSAVVVFILWKGFRPTSFKDSLFRSTNTSLHQPILTDGLGVNSTYNKSSRKIDENPDCTPEFREMHYMTISDYLGNTEDVLMQLFGLLATSFKFCYTPIIPPAHKAFYKHIDHIFDLDNIKRTDIDMNGFQTVTQVLAERSQDSLARGMYNLTLKDKCLNKDFFLTQERFIRFSISFRITIELEISEYLHNFFKDRSMVAIHVHSEDPVGYNKRKTPFHNRQWYKGYITKAMEQLKGAYNGLAFMMISNDMEWCQENIRGTDVHYSPYSMSGHDLALIARSDHVVLTEGLYGWCGAMLGKPQSVYYSMTLRKQFSNDTQIFLPSWIEI